MNDILPINIVHTRCEERPPRNSSFHAIVSQLTDDNREMGRNMS